VKRVPSALARRAFLVASLRGFALATLFGPGFGNGADVDELAAFVCLSGAFDFAGFGALVLGAAKVLLRQAGRLVFGYAALLASHYFFLPPFLPIGFCGLAGPVYLGICLQAATLPCYLAFGFCFRALPASLSAIAIACLRLFTTGPFPLPG